VVNTLIGAASGANGLVVRDALGARDQDRRTSFVVLSAEPHG
jgi:hypothetical protein